ncbi:MAG: PD40 domain-containing protein, partial [Deltaproteobacteria bacterium]|nr:PD40 domain-containing protein [Deltaproteobacteria bacterium]
MRRIVLCAALTTVIVGCPGDDKPPPTDARLGDSLSLASIEITPAEQSLEVTLAGGQQASFEATGIKADGDRVPLAGVAAWTVDEPTKGSVKGGMFTAKGVGGVVTVRATAGGVSTTATLNLMLRDQIAEDGLSATDRAKLDAATSTGAEAATLLYPEDGTMIPPNLAPMHFQWTEGPAADAIYRVTFKNGVADVSYDTSKEDWRPPLDVWTALLESGKGDSFQIELRSVSRAGGQLYAAAVLTLEISTVPLSGTIYYWATGKREDLKNGIMRLAFDTPEATDYFSEATSGTGRCVGCHALSRDGTKMMLVEYDEVFTNYMVGLEVSSKQRTLAQDTHQGDFFTFSPNSIELVSSLQGTLTRRQTSDGQLIETLDFAGQKASHPDWSADGSKLALVLYPTKYDDDYHFCGGSVAIHDWQQDTTTTLVNSTGDDDNNYYPVISPDGAFVVFNKSGSPNPLSNNDCGLYANPGAELFIVASSGGAPLRLDHANGKVARVNNSWAKWAPAGSSDEVWWLAFSSMRDYGSLLQNSKMP